MRTIGDTCDFHIHMLTTIGVSSYVAQKLQVMYSFPFVAGSAATSADSIL